MKKLTLILLLCCITGFAHAQFKLGIKAGVSTTSLSPSDLNILSQNGVDDFKLALENAKFGVHAGLIFRGQIGKFLIQPEVVFNSNVTGGKDTRNRSGERFLIGPQVASGIGHQTGSIRLDQGIRPGPQGDDRQVDIQRVLRPGQRAWPTSASFVRRP